MNEIKGRIIANDRIVGNITRKQRIAGTINTGTGTGSGGNNDFFEDVMRFDEDVIDVIDKYKLITTVTATDMLDESQKNLSNWSKNMTFPQFDNTYSDVDKSNNLQYMGGSEYERMYTAVNTVVGDTYSFEFDFKTSTGFVCNYGSNVEYAFVTNNISSEAFSTSSAIGYAVLDNTVSDTTKHYKIEFTATATTTYIGVDMGYMTDGVLTNLYFKDIKVNGLKYDYRIESE